MTKRKIKNCNPQGCNKSLGNSLVNKLNVKNDKKFNVLPEENNTKVVNSITHESDLNELLKNIELANEKVEIHKKHTYIIPQKNSGFYAENISNYTKEKFYEEYGNLLRIPRRPLSTTYSNAEELITIENKSFVDWKRSLAEISEGCKFTLTPYERNIELWRQLWRVIERSDVLVQIVDARNPLLFRNEDLEKYVKEVDNRKKSIILVNKSDLLSNKQLEEWNNYFKKKNISAVFWSAKNAAENFDNIDENLTVNNQKEECVDNFTYVKTSSEFICYLKKIAKETRPDLSSFVIGMVGYPNVGKSQTINAVIGKKKTSVSATPGKTKHFQTLIIDNELTFCDCPGLVMPSFGFNTSEMILNGVLPIAHMRDHFTPIQMLCNRLPKKNFEALYSILLSKSSDSTAEKSPTAHDLLTTIAFMKGFMSSSGIPDCSRAARLVLKDVVNGKIKWVSSPPGISQKDFDEWSIPIEVSNNHETFGKNLLEQLNNRNLLLNNEAKTTKLDANFFNKNIAGANYKRSNFYDSNILIGNKKHGNKNKKEKLRRIFAHLDA